jgi:hypothetical protein
MLMEGKACLAQTGVADRMFEKESLLLVRQLMLDSGTLGATIGEAHRLKCTRAEGEKVLESISSDKTSRKLSATDSSCSTVDTLSDNSGDVDPMCMPATEVCDDYESRMMQLSSVHAPLNAAAADFVPCAMKGPADVSQGGTQGSLRASAPEFVPSQNMITTRFAEHASMCQPQQIFSTNPVDKVAFDACGIKYDAHDFAVRDAMQAASQRYLDWRRYSGLPMNLCEDIPMDLLHAAHTSNMVELLCSTPPGKLLSAMHDCISADQSYESRGWTQCQTFIDPCIEWDHRAKE